MLAETHLEDGGFFRIAGLSDLNYTVRVFDLAQQEMMLPADAMIQFAPVVSTTVVDTNSKASALASSDEDNSLFEMTGAATGTMTGTVTDGNGSSIPSIYVYIFSSRLSEADLKYTTTNDNGEFQFHNLLAGTYYLYFLPPSESRYLSEFYHDQTIIKPRHCCHRTMCW